MIYIVCQECRAKVPVPRAVAGDAATIQRPAAWRMADDGCDFCGPACERAYRMRDGMRAFYRDELRKLGPAGLTRDAAARIDQVAQAQTRVLARRLGLAPEDAVVRQAVARAVRESGFGVTA